MCSGSLEMLERLLVPAAENLYRDRHRRISSSLDTGDHYQTSYAPGNSSDIRSPLPHQSGRSSSISQSSLSSYSAPEPDSSSLATVSAGRSSTTTVSPKLPARNTGRPSSYTHQELDTTGSDMMRCRSLQKPSSRTRGPAIEPDDEEVDEVGQRFTTQRSATFVPPPREDSRTSKIWKMNGLALNFNGLPTNGHYVQSRHDLDNSFSPTIQSLHSYGPLSPKAKSPLPVDRHHHLYNHHHQQHPPLPRPSSPTYAPNMTYRSDMTSPTKLMSNVIAGSESFEKFLFRNSAQLCDLRGKMIEYISVYGIYGVSADRIARAMDSCRVCIVRKRDSISHHSLRMSTSIWAFSTDGTVRMQQTLEDGEEIIPYVPYTSPEKVCVNVPTELRFYDVTFGAPPTKMKKTKWVCYDFEDAKGMLCY